ncbi:MAG TPA: molybdopterin cofactor-binding domain-containing protein, partial [Rhodanobacteraceae bacterium]
MGKNDTSALASVIGAPVLCKEDARFLTGTGQYTSDVAMPRQTYAYFLRSPHAHAAIRGIDVVKAKTLPGVVEIFTGADLTSVNGLPCGWLITGTDGKPMNEPPHPVLAQGKVRYVGDPVALVIAESVAQAKDAAEQIVVDYDVLPAVVDAVDALQPGAPQIHEQAPGNKCYTWALGDKAAVDAAFAKAAHVTKIDIVNNRLVPNAIEPRAALATYDRADDSYTLYVANQNPHVERLLMTAFVLGLPEHKVRVIAPDVGGGFGSKIYLYPEETAMVWASKRVN